MKFIRNQGKFFKNTLFFALKIILLLSLLKLIIYISSKTAFDEQYYLKSYPEVANFKMTPFEHYSTIGWRESKNPNADIDNNFYIIINGKYDKFMFWLNPLEHSSVCKLISNDCYTNPRQLKKAKLLKNPKHYLALMSIFRDEARFLKEWIEFYKLMGVEHFYLYNHLSQDNYMEVLKPYIDEGMVEIIDLTTEPKSYFEWNQLQTKAYTEGVNKVKGIVEWLVVVDSDEFLYPTKERDLKEVLKKYDDYATVSFNFNNFGSGEVERINEDGLLIEQLVMSEKPGNLHTSPVVKPRYVKEFYTPHFPRLKPGYEQITENYEYFYGPFSPYQSFNVLKANHYWARDWEFFKSIKLSRVHLVNAGSTKDEQEAEIRKVIKVNKDASVVYDDSILRFAPALRARMFSDKAIKRGN